LKPESSQFFASSSQLWRLIHEQPETIITKIQLIIS